MTWIRLRPALWVLLGSMVSSQGAGPPSAGQDQAPYALIAEANVFHLRSLELARRVSPEQPTLPKIILLGITTVLANPRALLEFQFPSSPGVPARTEHVILAERQREGPIEVLEIMSPDAAVKLNNSGTVMTVTFDRCEVPSLSQSPRPR